ncbi:adenosine receptor A2b-like [Ptychodera flava]|uniref:adenosine receptor A2b-like n=1 Tax=Ptychodera flava TaxID=63121 RepID=UPI00396A3154
MTIVISVQLIPVSAEYLCVVRIALLTGGWLISMLHLLAIAVDRYKAITNPLTYQSAITFKKVVAVIAVVWLVPPVCACTLFVGVDPLAANMTIHTGDCSMDHVEPGWLGLSVPIVCFMLPIVIMFFIYGHIYFIARKHSEKISKQGPAPNLIKTSFKREMKATKTLAFVLGMLIISFTPTAVLQIYLIFVTDNDPCDMLWITLFSVFLSTVNSAVNPAVYAYRDMEFRTAFKKILKVPFRNNCCHFRK